MAVTVIDTLRPKNGQNFPVVESVNVEFEAGTSVKQKFQNVDSTVSSISSTVETLQTNKAEATVVEAVASEVIALQTSKAEASTVATINSTVSTLQTTKANAVDLANKANVETVNAALAQKVDVGTYANGVSYEGRKDTLVEVFAMTPQIAEGSPKPQYFCAEDSHYYSWNGSAWDDNGTMNSAAAEVELARSGYTALKDRLDATDSANKATVTILGSKFGGIILSAGGSMVPNNRITCEKTAVKAGAVITVGLDGITMFCYATYDTSKALLYSGPWETPTIKTYTVLTDGYVKFSLAKPSDGAFTAEEKALLPDKVTYLNSETLNLREAEQARLAPDGTTYTTLKERLDSTDSIVGEYKVAKSLYSTFPGIKFSKGGSMKENNRITIDRIAVKAGTIVTVDLDSTIEIYYSIKDDLNVTVEGISWETPGKKSYELQHDGNFAFSLAKTSDATFTAEEKELLSGKVKYSVDVVSQVDELNAKIATLESKVPAGPTIPEYWQAYIDGKVTDINALKNASGVYSNSYVFVTDIHIGTNIKKSFPIAKYLMNNCNIAMCFDGGDNSSGMGKISKEDQLAELALAKQCFADYDIKRFPCIGNHDWAWDDLPVELGYYLKTLTTEEIYTAVFDESWLYDLVCGDDGTYYVVIDKAHKTAFLVLNPFDFTQTVDENGAAVPNKMNYYVFSQDQIDFMSAEVAKISGYSLCVMCHLKPARVTNATEMVTAIQNSLGTNTIVGWFAGHAHADSIEDFNGIKACVTTCDTNSPEDVKTAGTTNEQAFDVITINRATKTVNLTRIGKGTDRSFTYL